MATWHDHITDEQANLIRSCRLFFVATADPKLESGPNDAGPVNVSPKGGVPLLIVGPNRVAYLDYVGSGNETARHSISGGPITLMACSLEEENAGIVRLYGRASVVPIEDSPLASMLLESPAEELRLPERQVMDVEVTRTTTSCGYGVPVMKFVRERVVADRGRRYKADKLPASRRR